MGRPAFARFLSGVGSGTHSGFGGLGPPNSTALVKQSRPLLGAKTLLPVRRELLQEFGVLDPRHEARVTGGSLPVSEYDGRLNATAIADRLNAEGFCPPKRTNRFARDMVLRLTAHLGLARRQRHGSVAGLGPDEYRPMGLARRLAISRDTVRRWLRAGWLSLRRDDDGHHVIWADAGELRRLRELHDLPRTWANKTRLAKLKKPKPRPAR